MRQADNPGGSVSAAELTARVACALLLVPVLLSPAYEVANWPNVNTPTLVGVLIVAGLLGLTAGLSRLRPPLLRPLLLLAAILLTWGPAVRALAQRLPPTVRPPFVPHATACAACDELWANMTVLPGGLFVTAAVLLVAAAIPLAIWRRAPGRDAGGRVVRATYAVRCLALVCLLGGPPLGLFAWLSFANGDVYGSYFGIGIMVGLFGLLLFTAHSAAWALLRRSLPSAGTAVVCAALVVLLPLNPGLLSGMFSSRSEVTPRATVQATLANGWSVSATSATVAGPLPGAFDGDSETTWNSGSGAPAWIKVNFGRPGLAVSGLRLQSSRYPETGTFHLRVWGYVQGQDSERLLKEIDGNNRDGRWLLVEFLEPLPLRFVRVETLASDSTVAWREIEVLP